MSDMIFFLRLFRWFSLRQMRLRKWHVLTVLLGIALDAEQRNALRILFPKDVALKPALENRSTGQRMIRAYQLNPILVVFREPPATLL